MGKKTFPLGTVLSVTTGRLLASNGMSGVYEILNHMTGDSLYTHQLPRACQECRPFLLEQFPALAGVDASAVTADNWIDFMAAQAAVHGDELEVAPLPAGAHREIDPLAELRTMVDPDKIVVVKS